MKFLVIDTGIFTEHANALADGGKNEVLYFTDWAADPYPKLQDFAPGTGYDYLKKVKRLFDVDFESVDCIVNLDVGNNDLIHYLKTQYPDLSIVGSGRGEILEEDREGLKKWCKTLELDVQPYNIVHGVDALEEYAKKNKDFFVKIDIFRRSMETVHIEDYESAVKEEVFSEIRYEFGPLFSKKVKFLCEKAIKSDCEIGFDGFFTPKGGYLNKAVVGYEYKKGPYLGRVFEYDDLPDPVLETMEAFIPVLQKMDYRGPLSTEEKICKDGKHYLLDWCSRLLAPGSSLYPYAIKNWPDLIYQVGLGGEAEMEIPFKYVGALPLFAPDGDKHYVWIKIDPKYRDMIRPRSVCSDGKDIFSVRGNNGMVTLVAGGDDPQEVIEKIKEIVDYVEFDGIDKNAVNAMDAFPDLIESGKAVGIDF